MDNNNDDISFKITKTTQSNKSNPIMVKKRESSKRGNYILGETIGQGAFAKVKIATHMFTQEKVAIKILNKTKLIDKSKDIVRIQKEINILKRLRHKNIIHLYEIMESASSLYIVMEYCEGKELFDFIIKRKRLTEREACRFFQQMINGVEYLHLQNITHRDLKPENLLLDNKKRIKISDFGLSTISEECNSLLQTACGTPSYAPPEMLRGDEYLGISSDIWSCGIILYTMLCGNLPCIESKEELIYQCFLNKTFDFPSYLSHQVIDLLEKLLKFNPNERIGFDQIKRHPWFNLVHPQLKPGIILGVHKIPIDEHILNQVELFGYDKHKCYESVSLNKYDQFCAIYYFLLKKFSREGKSSISDMHSDEYEKYIRDIINWENKEDFFKPQYKDYWAEKTMSRNDMNKLNLLSLSNKDDNHSQSSKLNSQNSIDDKFNDQISINSNQIIEIYFKSKIDDELKKNMLSSDNETSMNSGNNHNNTFIKSNSNNTIPKQITFTSSSKKNKQRQCFYSQAKQDKYPMIKNKYELVSNNKKKTDEGNQTCEYIDRVDENKKQFLLKKLKKVNQDFVNEINAIDNCYLNNWNIVPQIAQKLIKTTVFKQYLLNWKQKVYKDELEEKFYLVQKYKSVVEIMKATKINIFPKKIYDWNYNAFEDYLYDEEDYIFGDSFNKNNINNGFVKDILRNIQLRNRFNPRRFLSKNFSAKKNDSLFKCDLFSAMKNSHKALFKTKQNKKCIVMPNSTLIHDISMNKLISRSFNDTLGSQKNTHPSAPYKSKYSSSSMNDISEDEELIQLQHNSPEKHISNPQQKRGITLKGIPMSKIPLPLAEHLLNNDIRARTKYIYSNNSSYPQNTLFLVENQIRSNQSCLSSNYSESNPSSKRGSNVLNAQNKSEQNISPSRNQGINNQKEKSINEEPPLCVQPFLQLNSIINSSNILTVSNTYSTNKLLICKRYDGLVDFWCVSSLSRDKLLLLIKKYFQKINYFCKINHNVIKSSQANIHIEIEITTLKDTSMYYLKIKRKKGEGMQYQNTIYGLLRCLHSE